MVYFNYKYIVFGWIVGGLDVFLVMEKVFVDDDDWFLEEIKILCVLVFVNLYVEFEEEEKKVVVEVVVKFIDVDDDVEKFGSWYSNFSVGVVF